jgi:hypothetical protein
LYYAKKILFLPLKKTPPSVYLIFIGKKNEKRDKAKVIKMAGMMLVLFGTI